MLVALILVVPSLERGALKLLDVISILFFAALTVAGFVLEPGQLVWLEDYSQAISSAALALAVLASLLFVPFTEQYARESVPQEFWSTPRFKKTNRVLTAVWGLVFAGSAVCGLLAQDLDSGKDLLNYIVPILLVVGGFKYTAYYREKVTAEAPGPPEPA